MAEDAPSTHEATAVSSPATDESQAHSHHGKTFHHGKTPHHGNTVAAWTSVGVLIVASLIMCLAVVFATVWLFVVGVVVVGIALVAGKLLAMAGYGMPRPADNRVTRGVR